MIRRNKIIASVAVSVMTGVLVAGNLVPLQGYYAFAQETGVTAMRSGRDNPVVGDSHIC